MKRKYNVQIGDKARCKVSGLIGTVTCRKEHLFGNIQFVIETYNEDGDKASEAFAIDWQQLELVTANVIASTPTEVTNGVELGDLVKDRVTKVEGTVTAIWHWLNGCVEAMVEFSDGEGGEKAVRSPIDRFKIKTKGKVTLEKPAEIEKAEKKTGGPSVRISRESLK
ncbi:MAG: hypothetical protein NXH70_02250 [Hyphomonas sp.]|nr:hypothetical protein [Hyphomonas sp.]